MTNPMIRIHDMATNEIVDREMNAAEFKQYKLDVALSETKANEALAKESDRIALLAKLGISAEEAALLIG